MSADDRDYLFDPSAPAIDEIVRIERLFAPARYRSVAPPAFSRRRRANWAYAVAASLVVAVLLYRLWWAPGAPVRWEVIAVAGGARIGAQPVSRASTLSAGEILVTDSTGAATLSVGKLGRVRVGPNSWVQLVTTRRAEHRLSVVGQLHARVWAPPRFFVVQTPSSLATDLGCIYDLKVDAAGNGVLTVESGEVELASHGLVSTVPAGAAAHLQARGPGVPFLVRSPAAFRNALVSYENAPSLQSLQSLLMVADSSATISLWHLLPRLGPEERGLVYARLNAISPAPSGVTQSNIVELDTRALNIWRRSLESNWSIEPAGLWRRAWRRAWGSLARN